MLEEYFRRQNMNKLLLRKNDDILAENDRKNIINSIVDFMVEAFGKGDPTKIEKRHKKCTAQAAVKLFIGLKAKIGDDELVRIIGFYTSTLVMKLNSFSEQTIGHWWIFQ